MFIAIEGTDGTGKSTLCQILAKKMNAWACATPPKKYLTSREHVDRNASSAEHYQFYKNGVIDASIEIKEALDSGIKVVVDRYWLTTYTYHQLRGVDVSIDDFSSIVMPTLTVILSLHSEVQITRLRQRGLSTDDRRMLDRQKELAIAFYRNVLEFGIPFIIIDTQQFSPEACAEIVISAIDRL